MKQKPDWIEEMIKRQSIPLTLREDTVEQFCAKYNIGVPNYYYYLYKKENQEKILEITLSKAKTAVPEILEKLIEKAKDGDMKAIDTYLDSVIKLSKNIDMTSGGKPLPILNLNAIQSNFSNSKDSDTE